MELIIVPSSFILLGVIVWSGIDPQSRKKSMFVYIYIEGWDEKRIHLTESREVLSRGRQPALRSILDEARRNNSLPFRGRENKWGVALA